MCKIAMQMLVEQCGLMLMLFQKRPGCALIGTRLMKQNVGYIKVDSFVLVSICKMSGLNDLSKLIKMFKNAGFDVFYQTMKHLNSK